MTCTGDTDSYSSEVDPNGDINLLGKTGKFNIDPVEVRASSGWKTI